MNFAGFFAQVAVLVYTCIGLGTFVFLTFFDGYTYTWWNWLIAVPLNIFMAHIWPIYRGILHWIF